MFVPVWLDVLMFGIALGLSRGDMTNHRFGSVVEVVVSLG